MPDREFSLKDSVKVRMIVLFLIIISVFTAYSVHLYSLQIIQGGVYQQKARDVARREQIIPTQRGEIFDRNYDTPLVMNVDSFAVEIIPAYLPDDIGKMTEKLAEVLNVNIEDIRKLIPARYKNYYKAVEIRDNVEYEKILYLAEHKENFPGVSWRSKPIRSYTETGSISHVLGYVGDITREEIQVLYNKGYASNSELGKSGLEKQYDIYLRGKEGIRYNTVDVRGRQIGNTSSMEKPPVLGKNLVLTIDRHIQTLCEKALGERMGSVVVLRPGTGEVLALVSYPSYNPNTFYTDESSTYYKDLSLDSQYPFLNRPIQSTYAPASVFKIIMSAAILEEEVFPELEEIDCKGKMWLGDRLFHCHKKTGHGRLNLEEALAESCDIYFWTVGREYLGIDKIVEYSRRFGFGEKTGIDLPGEAKGLVPTPSWKETTFHTPWVGGDTFNMSIGQGSLQVTPLQVANAVAMVANKGVNYVPHLLKQVRDPVTGEVIEEFKPQLLHNSLIREETFDKIQRNMRNVITKGTARVIMTTDAVKIAGKTGTGEVGYKDRWTSWFAAYGPYESENPEDQVVVVVMVEAENEWEWWAGKATNVIFQGIFSDQNYEEAVEDLNLWYLRNNKHPVAGRVE